MIRKQDVNGILLLDKPKGLSSNQALQSVKRLYNAKKAGHTGSLDPLATGMLPICFGEATKFSQFLLDSDKSYEVVAQLGVITSTGDSEGEIIATNPVENISDSLVDEAIAKWVGEIEQIPPMFSAVKHQGQPLYKLARKGIEVERKPRRIKIFSLQRRNIDKDKITLYVHCSKGTYVRTLIEDIGRDLKCGAHVIELRRTMVAPYADKTMYTLSELESTSALESCLLPIETAVASFPAVTLTLSSAYYLSLGQTIRSPFPLNHPFARVFSEKGQFIGLGEVTLDGRIKPHRLLEREQIAQ